MNKSIAMMVMVGGVLVGAACSSNTSPPPVTATVTCSGPTITQMPGSDDSDENLCTIDSGSCSDGNTYTLECNTISTDTFMDCGCAIDTVTAGGQYVDFDAVTCPMATATTVTKTQIERAWLDCGVELSF
jgi:hypothetical protein